MSTDRLRLLLRKTHGPLEVYLENNPRTFLIYCDFAFSDAVPSRTRARCGSGGKSATAVQQLLLRGLCCTALG